MKKSIGNKSITTTVYRIQKYDSIISGYFCLDIIDFVFKGKSLTEFTNSFSPHSFKKDY